MADLGNITGNSGTTNKIFRRILPIWLGASKPLEIASNGVISGVTQIQGVNTSGIRVDLYYRKTGLRIDSVVSDAGGNYAFADLYPDALYTVVALTDLSYNAVIYDKLTPTVTV